MWAMFWKSITCCKNMLLYYIILHITETRFDKNNLHVTYVQRWGLTKDVFLHQEISKTIFVQVDMNLIIIFFKQSL